MIFWIASYPKSGNTWLRTLISSYYYSEDGIYTDNIIKKIGQFPEKRHFNEFKYDQNIITDTSRLWLKAQQKINQDKKLRFFKTHNAFGALNNQQFTDRENSIGCIYIVRDPRNVITSLKNHYNFKNYDDTLKFLLNDKKVIGTKNSEKEVDLPHIISSWKNHFNSWKKMNKNYLLIKYENLINFPELEFEKITAYLENLTNKKFEKNKILDAIKKSSFDNLKKKEQSNGFIEAPISMDQPISFFNLGPKNNWQKLLDNKISKKIEEEFKKEMLELNYL